MYLALLIGSIGIILLPIYLNKNYRIYALIALIENFFILFTFLKIFFIETVRLRSFNVFVTVLIMYELSLIIRYFVGATGAEIGFYYYTISLILETVFGIFFIVFSEDNRLLKIKIKNLG